MTHVPANTNVATPGTPAAAAQTPLAPSLMAGKDIRDFSLQAPMIDVRGWDVVTAEGAKVGTVDRFMLDTVEHKPRYLSVTPLDTRGHMLLPIGIGALDRAGKQVRLDGVTPATLKTMPVLLTDTVTLAFERQLFGAISGKPVNTIAERQWYADPMYDAARLFGAKAPAQKS